MEEQIGAWKTDSGNHLGLKEKRREEFKQWGQFETSRTASSKLTFIYKGPRGE